MENDYNIDNLRRIGVSCWDDSWAVWLHRAKYDIERADRQRHVQVETHEAEFVYSDHAEDENAIILAVRL